MAKGNFQNGTASGKLGDTVFYRANGEQRSRIWVKPRNPKTIPQLMHRNQWRSASLAFEAFKPFIDKSMERTKHGNSYNDFIKRNVDISPYIYKNEYEYRTLHGQCRIAPYVVAWGDYDNLWRDITMFTPIYSKDGQRNVGMTLVLQFNPNDRRVAFDDVEQDTYQTTLGEIVTRIATFKGFPEAHLGMLVAKGDHDDWGYFYDEYAYAELFQGQTYDIHVTASFMQSEHTWSLQIDQNPVTLKNGWKLSATCTNTDITIYFCPPQVSDPSTHPSAATVIAVERKDGIKVSRSILTMQEWMNNPYSAYFYYNYAVHASQSFDDSGSRYPQTQILGN